MMSSWGALVLAALLLIDLALAISSRLLHCIRLSAWHGILIGLLPLAMLGEPESLLSVWRILILAVAAIGLKGWLLPKLLRRTMLKAQVKRELEPLVGYSISLMIVLLVAAVSAAFWFHAGFGRGAIRLAPPVAFTTMATGLLIIVGRKKALTQAIGFLFFENGITIFGLGMAVEYGLLVELGILLDVLVLVFVMGIAVFQISREFSHIDSDRLHLLNDVTSVEQEEENGGTSVGELKA